MSRNRENAALSLERQGVMISTRECDIVIQLLLEQPRHASRKQVDEVTLDEPRKNKP
jgi:hypothetical protein